MLRFKRWLQSGPHGIVGPDGSIISRGVSECTFEIEGLSATSPVVLGEAAEGPLLGAVTLETLGLMLNPLSRQLLPIRLFIGALQAVAAA